MSLDALWGNPATAFFRPDDDVLSNYLGALPFSINAPINTSFYDFYKTDEDKAEDILLQGGEGSANFTQEESNAIRNIGSEINEAYAQGFLSDVSQMIQDATGRTVAIRSDAPPPIRMTKKGGGFTYKDPHPDSFNTIYNTYIVPTSSPGFLEKDEEEEKEEESEIVKYDFVPLIEKEYSTSTSHSPSDLSGFTPSISAALANLNGVAG